MPKEKNYNPVQAQRKADKAREIKKGTSANLFLNSAGKKGGKGTDQGTND